MWSAEEELAESNCFGIRPLKQSIDRCQSWRMNPELAAFLNVQAMISFWHSLGGPGGADEEAQLCATAQLMLDPYYRTFKGFAQLVRLAP